MADNPERTPPKTLPRKGDKRADDLRYLAREWFAEARKQSEREEAEFEARYRERWSRFPGSG